MTKPVYVLGTGLSHNGSAVLLKDGRVCAGIEKERITRLKHDGGNDSEAIRYCLEAEGIVLSDVDLVVQSANFSIPQRDWFEGVRPFADRADPPIVTISHHLAHAWSAAGTAPFDDCAIMVIDGCGSPIAQCVDLEGIALPAGEPGDELHEKDSFYRFDGRDVVPLFKDFSLLGRGPTEAGRPYLAVTRDSIGGFYAAISNYVFGNLDDVGKLMGLAPYGRPDEVPHRAFAMHDGRVSVETGWQSFLDRPSAGYPDFRTNFQYYADIARWAQREVEDAVCALFRDRLARFPSERVAYAGGVALNAVANARLLDDGVVGDFHIEPAAGDNGIALGCAFYGWMKVLERERVPHDGSTAFGRAYGQAEVRDALASAPADWCVAELSDAELADQVAALLAQGKTVGWFREGCEFGPRALGFRSILAHPGLPGLRDHINAAIKFREDFRPFAPAVLPEYASVCFESGRDSPYMILVDRTRPDCAEALSNVTHVDGTARVQTVDRRWNPAFARLIEAFHRETGIPAVLNTSLNRRGMPIVETPAEAVALFAETALDALVLQNVLVLKA